MTCGGAADERWLTPGIGLLKLAKGSGLVCGRGAGVAAGVLKFRVPKASSRPPKLDCS